MNEKVLKWMYSSQLTVCVLTTELPCSSAICQCLVSETEPNIPMPPPKLVANSLKKMASDSVQEWYNKYGLAYKKLALAYDYLKTCKKVTAIMLFM